MNNPSPPELFSSKLSLEMSKRKQKRESEQKEYRRIIVNLRSQVRYQKKIIKRLQERMVHLEQAIRQERSDGKRLREQLKAIHQEVHDRLSQ